MLIIEYSKAERCSAKVSTAHGVLGLLVASKKRDLGHLI